MSRVVIIQEHLPHYRQRFYELLRAELRARGIGLDLVYSPKNAANLLAGNLSWATPVSVRKVGRFAWQNVHQCVHGADLVIVQQESKYAANYLLELKCCFSSQKFACWGHGKNFQAENASVIGERLKIATSVLCDWWFAYNDLSAKIVEELGFAHDRITSVQNSIDTESISAARQRVSSEQLVALRAQMGIQSENIAVFTGGLYREKRLSFLLEACQFVRNDIKDFELIVIGKGPESDLIKTAAAACPWVHYLGAKSDEEKVPYWMLSKLLLMPGLVGLVVLDSFALGVPMVTTDYPYHSPEISYLQNGVNGVIVSPWSDSRAYANHVAQLMLDQVQVELLARNALEAARFYTVQKMADNFANGVASALAAPKLSRLTFFRRKRGTSAARTRRIRLGVVIRSMAPYLRDFYDALDLYSENNDLKVFIGQRGADWVNPWDSRLMLLKRTDHVFVNARVLASGRRTILPSHELLRALEFYRPTILLLNEYSPLSVFGALYATLTRTPWLVATDIGQDYHYPYPRFTLLQRCTHHIVNRYAHGILALTPSAAKRATKLGKPYLLCPHAIDTDVYIPPENPRAEGDAVQIIAVGNLIFRKGYDLLLAALAAMQGMPHEKWNLTCYGAGASTNLETLAAELGISNYVNFSNFLGVSDLIGAYQAADIFVLPSRSDTYGVVVHEAAACGLPLIVSKYAGASETLVKEGINGYVVDPKNSEMLADRLKKLILDPALRISFGGQSRNLSKYWDVKHNARRAIEWITKMQYNAAHNEQNLV